MKKGSEEGYNENFIVCNVQLNIVRVVTSIKTKMGKSCSQNGRK